MNVERMTNDEAGADLPDPRAAKPAEPPPTPKPVRLFRSVELFGDARTVCIEHAGAIYRLQITSRGKLILQK